MTVAGAVLTLAACGGASSRASSPSSPSPADHPLTINLVHDFVPYDQSGILRQNDKNGSPCGLTAFTRPTATLAFMKAGSDVVVKDAGGVILATGTLASGTATDIKPAPANTYTCTWNVEIPSVADSAFYTVFVGEQQVGNLSRADLQSTNWTANVQVGVGP